MNARNHSHQRTHPRTPHSPPYHHITRAHTPMRAPPSLIHASPMDSATISGPGGMVRAWLLAEPRTPPPAYPETQLGPGDAGMAWAADWQPDPKPHCLTSPHVPGARINEVEVASSLRPPYPPPRARPGSHLYRPCAERRRRPKYAQQQQHQKADAPGPRPAEQWRPRHTAQRAGLRTGGLAGKCAAPGLAGQAVVLCGCACQGPLPSPATHSCHSTHAQRRISCSPSIPPVVMDMPKGQGGELETDGGCYGNWRAVARATDLAVTLVDREEKIDSVEWIGGLVPTSLSLERRYMTLFIE